MTKATLRIVILLATVLGLLAVPTLNVVRGFAGLGDPPFLDVAAVFLAASALGWLAPPSRALVRATIASVMAFIMHATLMSFWYSADSEAEAVMVLILGLPASLLLGAVVFAGSWLWVMRGGRA